MKPRWILTIAAAITIGIAGVASAVAIGTRDVSDHTVAGETGAPPLSSRTTGSQDSSNSQAPSQVRNIRLAATNSSSFTIVWNAGDTDITSLYEVSVQNGPTKRVGVERFSYPWLDATRAVITVRAVSASGMYSAPASLTITPSSVPQNRPDDSAPKATPSGHGGDEAGTGASSSGSGKSSDPGDRGSRDPGRTPTTGSGEGSGDGEGSGNTGGGNGSGSRPSTPGGSGGSGSGGSGGTSPSGSPSSPLETPTPSKPTPSTPTPSTPSSPAETPTHPVTAPTTAQGSGKTPTDTPASTRSADVQSSRPTTSRASSPSSTPSQPDRYPGPTSSSPGSTGDTPSGGSTGSGSPKDGDTTSAPA